MATMLWIKIARWLRREGGSVLGEYGIWIVLVVIVAAAALSPLGTQLAKVFRDLYTKLGGA